MSFSSQSIVYGRQLSISKAMSPILQNKVRYEVSSEALKISSVFGIIEEHKDKLQLQDYGVSQTSLEQVFNQFAAKAEERKQGGDDK